MRSNPLLLAALAALPACAQRQQPMGPAHLVNPFIGTGGHGHTFPGACVPNGLVQLSPDTRRDGYMDWDGCSGYHYSDSIIYGFSHTHLSGTGVADLCDVLLTPILGTGSMAFDRQGTASVFRHADEEAAPGYYKVELLGPPAGPADKSSVMAARPSRAAGTAITAELTSTARVGMHRYRFAQGETARIAIDLRHRDQFEGRLDLDPGAKEVTGERRSHSWARDQRLFFCIRFDRAWKQAEAMPSNYAAHVAGLDFGPLDAPLLVKVGISAVSVEGARRNLEAEVPHWDFDLVRRNAEADWNAKLGKVRVKGGTPDEQLTFYTALYHCYVAPYRFNDADGQYRGMDGQVHRADHDVYTVFSLWDTFRGLHPLMTILEPEMTRDWIRTFLLHYQQGGRLPVWELWGNETDCMIGYHSASVIADAYQKGIRDFDAQLALEAMAASADADHFGLKAYRQRGFISSEDESESVSRTLEYAYDDGCIARMASLLKQRAASDRFAERSTSWLSLFDPASGFFRARRNGGFAEPFDPFEVNFHFTEANAWQYSLFAPQGIERLTALHGGEAGLEAHLDRLFSAQSATTGREQADITGLIGQNAHGNEPSHHMAYLYNRAGRPEKTRAMVKRILHEQYRNAPDGLSGNEDCGQMSAWYVLSALGFYPISPGIDKRYELGYPLFDEAVVQLPDGKTWSMRVDAEGKERKAPPANGGPQLATTPVMLTHDEVMAGGTLIMDAARVPYPRFTRNEGMTVIDGAYLPERRPGAPLITAAAPAFKDELMVMATGKGECELEEAGVNRTCPMNKPFTITGTSTVRVRWSDRHRPVEARYMRMDGNRSISLTSSYANQYAAGGGQALVDGLRGGTDFRTGEWQGFQGQDLVALVDLGRVRKLKRVGLSVLQDQKSWIWLPAEVSFSFSENHEQWSTVTVGHEVPREADGALVHEIWTPTRARKARWVAITAKSAGSCPDWHPGKGGATWIFADEVLIEEE
jgi:predicted alpha-1,2-mannosidase